jgi:hypothetical protein
VRLRAALCRSASATRKRPHPGSEDGVNVVHAIHVRDTTLTAFNEFPPVRAATVSNRKQM